MEASIDVEHLAGNDTAQIATEPDRSVAHILNGDTATQWCVRSKLAL
jgi:hypothetical protein